jgi:hypothetical protein
MLRIKARLFIAWTVTFGWTSTKETGAEAVSKILCIAKQDDACYNEDELEMHDWVV